MKILHIASADLWAGAENQIYQLLNILSGNDDCFQIIVFNSGKLADLCKDMGIDVFIVDEKQISGINIFKEVYKLIKREKPDLVHTHGYKEHIIGTFASKLAGVNVSIRTLHGKIKLNNYLLHSLDTLSASLQDRHVAVSDELLEYVNARYCNRGQVIENGIIVEDVVKRSQKDVIALPTKGKKVVGFVGRLDEVKNPWLFIDIQKELIRKGHDDFIFILFGEGTLRARLEQYVNDNHLANNIYFAGYQDRIEAAMSQLDVLLITSHHEGLPMTLLEAMALKIPVISAKVGGISTVLDGGNAGTLIAEGSLFEFVNELENCINNQEVYERKANIAATRVRNKYSSKKCAQKYMKLYRELIDNGR